MIMTTTRDPECKYLHPTESTEPSGSGEGMPGKVDVPSEGDILAEFPKEMLMTKEDKHFKHFGTHGDVTHGIY